MLDTCHKSFPAIRTLKISLAKMQMTFGPFNNFESYANQVNPTR